MRIRLDQALLERGLCSSRTEAQELIKSEKVLLNKVICTKRTKLVTSQDDCIVLENRKYVSRGGEKLEGIFRDIYGEQYKKNIENKTALDVGSSTGGFTDFLLQNNISEVDAVDVGTKQLHDSLLSNKKVNLFENTDIRNFKSATISKEYDFIVADLSFISIKEVVESIVSLGTKNITKYFLLIKPQFEVGKGNTKKGVVKNETLVSDILNNIQKILTEQGLFGVRVFPCHIKGKDGNQEYFIYVEV